jgi:hypothetical protein
MKLLRVLGLLAAFLAPSFGQTDRVDLTADKLVHDAALVRGLGHARARVGDLVLQADEATLRNQTGELELRGHVHIVLPAREDHTLFRYGSGNLLTDQPAGLTADQATVKNGLLEASGNIVVVPIVPELPKVQLRCDEFFMKLKTADATLRGNVRPSGFPEERSYPPNRARSPVMPPEVIK